MFIYILVHTGETRDLGTQENSKKRTMARFWSSRIQGSESKYADVEVCRPWDLLLITRSLIHHQPTSVAH
jgi:hypothetical protein